MNIQNEGGILVQNLKRAFLFLLVIGLISFTFNLNNADADESSCLLTAEGNLKNGGTIVITGDIPKEVKKEDIQITFQILQLHDSLKSLGDYELAAYATVEDGRLSCTYKLDQVPKEAEALTACISLWPRDETKTTLIRSNLLYLDPQLFSDVPHEYWAYKQISELAKDKVLGGYPDGTFKPDGKVSREEFAKMLVLALGLQTEDNRQSSFIDVKTSQWASPAIEAVKQYLPGFKNSDGTYSFRGNCPILREDVATAIVRAKGYDRDQTVDSNEVKSIFKDSNSISASLRKYVVIAVNNEVMSGYPDQTFRGQEPLTRAEVATLLYKLKSLGDGTKTIIEE